MENRRASRWKEALHFLLEQRGGIENWLTASDEEPWAVGKPRSLRGVGNLTHAPKSRGAQDPRRPQQVPVKQPTTHLAARGKDAVRPGKPARKARQAAIRKGTGSSRRGDFGFQWLWMNLGRWRLYCSAFGSAPDLRPYCPPHLLSFCLCVRARLQVCVWRAERARVCKGVDCMSRCLCLSVCTSAPVYRTIASSQPRSSYSCMSAYWSW